MDKVQKGGNPEYEIGIVRKATTYNTESYHPKEPWKWRYVLSNVTSNYSHAVQSTTNSVALGRKGTIPTDRPPLVDEK
jgi:hypothetical protein